VWLVIGAVVGVLTGFTVGQFAIDDDDDEAATTTVPADDPGAVPGETTTTAPTTEPPRPSTVVCSGSIPSDLTFAAVVGVADAGAGRVAAVLGVDTVVERPFGELTGGGFETFRSEVIGAAAEGPVLFVARLSSGPLQKNLSQELHELAPGSATIVADPGGVAVPEALAEFAEPSAIVALDPAVPDPWVEEVAAIARGEATCPGPEG
jgi:hypothetical protein